MLGGYTLNCAGFCSQIIACGNFSMPKDVGVNKFKQWNYSGGGKTENKLELRPAPKDERKARLKTEE